MFCYSGMVRKQHFPLLWGNYFILVHLDVKTNSMLLE